MKKCPVCKASTFDDMDRCYSCLHIFGEEDGGAALLDAASAGFSAAARSAVAAPNQAVVPAPSPVASEGAAGRPSSLPHDETGKAEEPFPPIAAPAATAQLPRRYRLEIALVPVD